MALPIVATAGAVADGRSASRDRWRDELPTLVTARAVLREIQASDAAPLAAALARPAVQRYLPVGPTTVDAFARFIKWVRRERRAGRYLCFSVVPRTRPIASGLFQIWPIEPGFGTAEFGFALDEDLWGSGLFVECATAVIDFAVETLGVRRLECRAAEGNGRGTAALLKLGAVREGTLRQCFRCPEGNLDHVMWSILADEWRGRRAPGARR
jgi:[ribosomal protein S5]-alanine N-acetyltransferase